MPIEVLARVSAKSVEKGTGKNWDEWIKILTKAGAKNWDHKEIVAFLKKKHKLTGWWQQSVTIGYETHIGRRRNGSNLKGEYSLTATRTLPGSPARIWKALSSPEGIAIWLTPLSEFEIKKGATFECDGGVFGEVRTMKAPERARLTWQETDWLKPSVVQIFIVGKRDANKSILVFNHDKLREARQRDHLRARWKKALEEFHEFLES